GVDRVEDLLLGIEKNLKTLENQARKTERYYRIKEQYKASSVALATFRLVRFSEHLAVKEKQAREQQTASSTIAAAIGKQEAALQQLKKDSLAKEKNLAIQQKHTNEHVAKIRAYESDKKLRNEQLRNLQDKESRLANELTQDKQQLNHVLYNL